MNNRKSTRKPKRRLGGSSRWYEIKLMRNGKLIDDASTQSKALLTAQRRATSWANMPRGAWVWCDKIKGHIKTVGSYSLSLRYMPEMTAEKNRAKII